MKLFALFVAMICLNGAIGAIPDGLDYFGCVLDNNNVFNDLMSDANMSLEKCLNLFVVYASVMPTYIGIKGGNMCMSTDVESNDIELNSNGQCTSNCPGDSTQECGGSHDGQTYISVYWVITDVVVERLPFNSQWLMGEPTLLMIHNPESEDEGQTRVCVNVQFADMPKMINLWKDSLNHVVVNAEFTEHNGHSFMTRIAVMVEDSSSPTIITPVDITGNSVGTISWNNFGSSIFGNSNQHSILSSQFGFTFLLNDGGRKVVVHKNTFNGVEYLSVGMIELTENNNMAGFIGNVKDYGITEIVGDVDQPGTTGKLVRTDNVEFPVMIRSLQAAPVCWHMDGNQSGVDTYLGEVTPHVLEVIHQFPFGV